ncbi:MAG: UDP-N-acetylmuramoyl-tripeptide--D-alanyl-D-alanine ligase [Clostridia bacterium]|nr:UDP-N-acetylmuramoyl-tripeptide--D-alanyl-D-alanine ligase [Clostridia bacterium]
MEWILNIRRAARAMGGEIHNCDGDELIQAVSTDTRKIASGALFFALSGERFDGHKFVPDAVAAGAVCCVVSRDAESFGSLPVIVVEDTHKALRDLAEAYRKRFQVPVVGITGSVGKTSTKEMIASVLGENFRTHVTKGNFNNEIGLPLTVFDLQEEDEMMVLEMGMSNFGEISRLTKIAKPDTAVITNIGVSHIEHLGSREGIRQAKFEIMEGLQMDGTVILNGDDDLLWEARGDIEFETLYFGIHNKNCDLCVSEIRSFSDGSEFTCKIDGEMQKFSIGVPGEHHVYNALAAILVGMKYNIGVGDIKAGIRKFSPSGLRQTLIEYPNYKVIRDCYNASPASMKSGLEVLSLTETTGRRVACLADMLELGAISQKAHLAVGKLAVKYGVECLITVGQEAKMIAQGAIEEGMNPADIHQFETNAELIEKLAVVLRKQDLILVKGSRGMRLEEIADAIGEMA